MTVHEFLLHLSSNPKKTITFRLPDGSSIPVHYHITEVGHVTRRFIDCGGTRRVQETCLLQTWVHDDVEHRLVAGKLAAIFERAGDILPHHDFPIEVEHESNVVAQYPLEGVEVSAEVLQFQLGTKHTDCLARGICLPDTCSPQRATPIPVSAPSSCCAPDSGCCG